jgi:lipid-A-disaccharide synthase-like uncharacterized protein
VHRIRAFRAELEALNAAGVAPLTQAQSEEIVRYHDALLQQLALEHDVDRTDAAGQLSRGMQIAAFIAAVALTAAVYSLVARFWGRLDLPLQATLLCAFPLMALVGVELSSQRERTLYIASIFALVAYGTYWLAVFVLSELVNVPVTPVALWGGALFGVALALPYGFRIIFGGALIALLVALAGSVFQAAGMPWTLVPEYPEIVTAAAFLLVFVAPRLATPHRAFAAVTRGVAFAVGFAGLLLLSTAGPASLLPTPSRVTEVIYQAAMLIAATTALVVSVRKQWTETVFIAAAALTLFIFIRFVDWFWDALPRFVFFFLLAAVAFAWLVALRRLRARVDKSQHGFH